MQNKKQNVKMTIRPITKQETNYLFAQSSQLQHTTCLIGYLRGDFGRNGDEWWRTFFDLQPSRITESFKNDFDEVVNALREDARFGCLLKNRSAMRKYCSRFPESKIEGEDDKYGFRVDTEMYSYLIKAIPVRGDYNFYVYCHEKRWLDWYHEKASKGIRFITSGYDEKFRIPDGGKIRITLKGGETYVKSCRYVDDAHVEVGSNLYHICEYAELCESNGTVVEPVNEGGAK